MLYRTIRTGLVLGMAAGLASGLPARASDDIKPISWSEYMSSAPMAAAIASAISMVDHCGKKPLLFQQIDNGDGNRSLVFTCNGTEDEEASGILQIQRLGDAWIPMRFDFAG